jgi:hypothetical protein
LRVYAPGVTSTEVAPARVTTPWIGAGVVAALLLVGGALPGYTAVLDYDERGPDHTLLGSGAWPYFLALALALAGVVAAAATGGRAPTWVGPAALTVTSVPAFALTTELSDPPEYYRPYSDAAAGSIRDIEVGPGAWITFTTLMCLAVGAVIWLGRNLTLLADQRYAAGALVLIIVTAVVSYQIAEAAADDTCGPGRPVENGTVSSDWAFWLVLYLPAVMAVAGIGAMTRRRFASGAYLIAGGLAAFIGLVVVGLEIASPCLE